MNTTYVPILKGKEGEYAGLEASDIGVRQGLLPLVEVPPVPYDYVNERPRRSLEDHVQGVARRIQMAWGNDRPMFLDFSAHAADEVLNDGSHALHRILAEARDLGVRAVPVVYLTSSDVCIAAASAHAREAASGVCVRLVVADFDEENDLAELTDVLLTKLGVAHSDIDLVLDLKEVSSDSQREMLLVRGLFGQTPELNGWRRVILAAASFPEDLRDVDADSVTTIPRHDWGLWQSLMRRPERLARKDLIFGDYGITHPSIRELDPRTMRMSASIRYTGPTDWVVAKGRNVRQFGYEQYFALCETLVRRPEYAGPDFSWGDRFIADTADRKSGPGNATTWRKVGTNHHITLVTTQLANMAGS